MKSQSRTIVMVAPYFPPQGGGLERYAQEIARQLQEDHQWRIVIITSGTRAGKDVKEVIDGFTIYRLAYQFKISNTPLSFRWAGKIRRILKTENPDIINIHTPVPGIGDVTAMLVGKKPLVVTYHTGSMNKNRFVPDIFIWFYEHGPLRLLLRRADRIVCVSDFVRLEFLRDYLNKSITITPGVDVNVFKPVMKNTVQTPIILFVGGLGRAEKHKGLITLLDAMKILKGPLPNARLVIVGDGDMKSEYQAYAQNLGLEDVSFRGRLMGDDLVATYQEANVFALPSSNESFGIVLLEAMACELPVVTTMVGGIPLIIENGETGFLITPHDPRALAEKLAEVFADPQLAEGFGKKGRIKVMEKFKWDRRAQIYHDLLEQTVANYHDPSLKSNSLIAQVSAYYPPHLGGMEMVAQEIALELTRRQYPVTVITSDEGAEGILTENIPPYYHVERLKSVNIGHTPIMPSSFFRLLDLPKNTIIHIHIAQAGIAEFATLAAKLKHFPLVAHFHLDVEPSGSLGVILPFYKRYFLGPVLRSADKVIVFSDEQRNLIERKYNVKKERIVIIPNGVGEKFFLKGTHGAPHHPLRLLYVGRLERQKRVERLIEAVSLLTVPTHLTIVGDGELHKELEGFVRKLGLTNVSFEGRKNNAELRDYYRNADVFLTSSDQEGMSLVALEAMASGLPIIGSNVIGTRELLNGVGLLVDEPYAQNFAEVIAKLNSDPDKLKNLSRRSVKKAKEYSWSKLIDRLERIYKEISP